MYLPEKFLNKKIIVIFALILVAGGIFYWQYANKEIKGSPDDYEIIETAEGIFVENKKAGLFVKAPNGWEVKKMEVGEGGVTFYPRDIKIKWENNQIVLPLEVGCIIGGEIIYRKINFEEIKKNAKQTHIVLGVESDEFEEIIINNHKALKNTFNLHKYGPGIGVYILVKNKVYTFYLYWNPDEKERCIQEFDQFLETVSIYSD